MFKALYRKISKLCVYVYVVSSRHARNQEYFVARVLMFVVQEN